MEKNVQLGNEEHPKNAVETSPVKTVRGIMIGTVVSLAFAIGAVKFAEKLGIDKNDPKIEARQLLSEIDQKINQLENVVHKMEIENSENLDLEEIKNVQKECISLRGLLHLVGDYESNVRIDDSSLNMPERILLKLDREKQVSSVDEGVADIIPRGSLKKISVAVSPEERKRISDNGMKRILDLLIKIETTRLRIESP